MSWTMVVPSKQVVEGGWAGEARRLRSFLDVVSECMRPVYREPVVWCDEDLTVEQWRDLAEVTAEIERQRLRDDEDRIVEGGRSGGAVVAYREGAAKSMIGNLWNVGGDGEWKFNAALTFRTGDPVAGRAFPLGDHPVEWLVRLLSASSASVGAEESRIETNPMADELIDARYESIVGELTLAANGIGDAVLPDSVTAYPCPVGYPNGVVLVADLERAASDPASLVDDLLTVDDLIRSRS